MTGTQRHKRIHFLIRWQLFPFPEDSLHAFDAIRVHFFEIVQFGSIGQAVLVASVALVISALEGWLLDPPLMGKAEDLNTVAILVGLVYWTWAWGGWGTVLAVPLLSVTKSVCARTTGLRPVAELLRE